MDSKLKELETLSRGLEPDDSRLAFWISQLREMVKDVTANASSGAVFNIATAGHEDFAIWEGESDFLHVCNSTIQKLTSSGINTASGSFFGFIPGGGVPAAAFGDFLGALTNRYSGLYFASPVAASIENAVINWLRSEFQLGPNAWGVLTSGGSSANLTALIAARESAVMKGKEGGVVFYSEDRHYSIDKALFVSGMSGWPIETVAVDRYGAMDADDFKSKVAAHKKQGRCAAIVISTAGTTSIGAVDPIERISKVCEAEEIWHHCDGAYGGFFYLTAPGREKLRGIERVDSLSLDPHKGLFMPYGVGACLVKNGHHLKNVFSRNSDSASYLEQAFDPANESPTDYSFELTRPFRGLRVWLPLKIHGIGTFRAALEEKILLAQWAYEQLSSIKNIELLQGPNLSLCCFRVSPSISEGEAKTKAMCEAINGNGSTFLSTVRVAGKTYIRLCVLSFRSHLEHVRRAVGEIRKAAEIV